MGWDVPGYHRTGGDKGVLADGYPADNSGVGADAGTALDDCGFVVLAGIAREGGTRRFDVGKDHAGAAENIVSQNDPFVYGDVILDFDVIANLDIVGNKNILPQRATLAYLRLGYNMAEVPDLCSPTYFSTFINAGGFVDEVILLVGIVIQAIASPYQYVDDLYASFLWLIVGCSRANSTIASFSSVSNE